MVWRIWWQAPSDNIAHVKPWVAIAGVELASLCLKQSLLTAHAEGTSSKAAMKQRWGYFPEGWSAHNSL
ncbi:hypothetical protein Y1Q_0009215 [Alligator mississippiensis]|uniref:Uncharacterized protein n=1 Tax=Alligator mississippiensis TaxID=8496 RepID=A0A151M2U7_ALLMI|nr:hypothetical protein Y1Q_0009215 [Alligator mississippiensis]